ncbi:hypothetical protein [Ilumatobacter coccineus]|uniref:Uncharacterized protein n=1 Tax=Ilumatobacter coccineus (strain NBRC 103263 / KCTC 29153 / YM16-304) TaxID=1313172 RepID=A0A6C7E291_ILUCY|nr:hypothetical protein [Ilumatobacter coccineus]BAN02204.1 hypothetical protein YM304_18900 [Ilumatobacter coccineus YM16-304]
MHRRLAIACFSVVALSALSACGGSDEPTAAVAESSADATEPTAQPTTEPAEQTEASETVADELFPDVIDATATLDGGTWTVSATLSAPYDSPERYADAWRVVGPDGTVYAERILTHDHASEQPFTRSQSGIEIPDDVATVTIEGRDQISGYGGQTFELALPR